MNAALARCSLALFLALLSGPTVARAAVDCQAREVDLPHVCKGGANDGNACAPEFPPTSSSICLISRPSADCPDGACVINLFAGRGTKFRGILTVVVDDQVTDIALDPAASNVVAVTLLLDLGKPGVIAQTYQDSGDPTAAPPDFFGVPINELVLVTQGDIDAASKKARGFNDMLFRSIDNQMADALRTRLGILSGKPVITRVTGVAVTSATTSPLGTVLRLKVKGGFVP